MMSRDCIEIAKQSATGTYTVEKRQRVKANDTLYLNAALTVILFGAWVKNYTIVVLLWVINVLS